jgi:putative NIF3 family GTP cyclohydrolase 1 type 2
MNRGQFIRNAGMAAFGLSLSKTSFPIKSIRGGVPSVSPVPRTAGELNRYMNAWVKLKEQKVDRIIIGNPDTPIKKVGTCWMPYWSALKRAVELGINVLVVHEPTFYTHWDLDEKVNDYHASPEYARKKYLLLVEEKKYWIHQHELVIIRNHDVIDQLQKTGIPFALGALLGFSETDIMAKENYYNVYRIPGQRAIEVARAFAGKLKALNQPGVAFYGDENYLVSSVGVGTGCYCDPLQVFHLEPDMFIGINDTIRTWIHTTYAMDSGRPLLVIDHGTSEENGMRWLCELLREQIPEIEFIHLPQGCSYQWVTA